MQFGCATQSRDLTQKNAPLPAAGMDDIVAVIDDDLLMRQTLAANLDAAGFKAVSFAGGSDVLAYLGEGGQASVLLLDWSMPGMNGPEVLRRLRARGHDMPVVYLTGHAQPVFEETALADGAVDFVDKSRSFGIVLLRLRLALAGAKRRQDGGAAAHDDGPRFDEESARIYWRGSRVKLTLSEVKIVRFMMAQAGRDVSYRAIYDQLRGEGFQAGDGVHGYRTNVRAIIRRIRRAFQTVDPAFDMIQNYPGFGYRWKPGTETAAAADTALPRT
jgi:two-component system response regulator ChvI